MNALTHNESRRGPPSRTDAVEPISADSKPHEMTDPDDIGESLTMLATSGDPVSIYPAAGGDVVMARILSVDPELPHFVIQLNEESVLPPGEYIFVAWLRNAKFQFRLNDPHWNALPDQPTLIPAEFPERCQVLNRRAFARLETPLGVYETTVSFAVNGRQYELQLFDLSMGGVGIRGTPGEAAGLRVGHQLQNVLLKVGPDAEMTCSLEIRLMRRFRSFLAGQQVHIGCQFVNLSPQMQDQLGRMFERMAHIRSDGG